jgi:hypothetical protein
MKIQKLQSIRSFNKKSRRTVSFSGLQRFGVTRGIRTPVIGFKPKKLKDLGQVSRGPSKR